MTLDANSLSTNLMVTAVVALLVAVLPWADRSLCRRLGVNLHGVSTNPQADRILKIRQGILVTGLAAYVFIYIWVAFLSRTPMNAYSVHVAPLEDLKNAFRTDHGFTDVFARLFQEGFAAFQNVRLVRPQDITQFYSNIMFFVPLGYLLPYTFRWFRERVWTRPVGVCFLISFVTENMQLISRRGMYDLDDMISNSLGGLIGQTLYILLAYILTHPDWRKELHNGRAWRKKARKLALYPRRRMFEANTAVLWASDRQAAWDFYVQKLGYRPVSCSGKPEESRLLLQLGQSRLEIRCGSREALLTQQCLQLHAAGLPALRENLLRQGIDPGEYQENPHTGQRELRFAGPDEVQIILTEAE